MFRKPAGRDAAKQTKAKKRGAGRGKHGEKRPTADQRRAQERNTKCAKNASEAESCAATPPSAAAWQAVTGDFKVLDKRAPFILVAECYRTQFDLEPAYLWQPIYGYDGNISGIMKAMPQTLDGSWDVVRSVMVDMQECLRIKVQYRGERHSGSGGHKKLIEMDYVEAQFISKNLESGILVKHATTHVKEHRAECDLTKIHVGMIAMISDVLRPATLHPN